ncbi:MAG: type IV pilin [Methanomicrobiales archaeon HGW-Methanomicrobiales-6]|nr:MAG: type IV pilin [Methanomicrobiales archaeon HGW-Methanomicrobiales-6]
MKFRENEDAVSPVIGVILMVAITVILAAVIAAFVFGMGGSVESNKVVAATAQLQGENVVVTYQGGADNDQVAWLRIYVDNGSDTKVTKYVYNTTGGKTDIKDTKPVIGTDWKDGAPEVGVKISAPAVPGKTLVTVVARFTDGKEQVILDRNL